MQGRLQVPCWWVYNVCADRGLKASCKSKGEGIDVSCQDFPFPRRMPFGTSRRHINTDRREQA